ncbi:MAG TPA: flagellar basal body rod C-terminal domain-containing protein, partial [Mobilitalea sp.]|nr:flagellar basal body rod C-terminal domain-containing protein [Mobilitalea sp.]
FNTFNSQTGGYYEEVPGNQPLYGSYYFMTASNFTVSKEIEDDPNRLATSNDVVNGIGNNDMANAFLAMRNDKSLYKQGAPDGFFQTLVAEIGVDTKKASDFADNQDNILKSIQNQRLSISGVDTDEEAMNLVKYQNAYNMSAKVISVMNEVYDKLINGMGV